MTSKTVLAAIAAILSASGLTAQPRVVHYDDAAVKTAMPNFKGVVICLNFGGKLAADAKRDLMKMGARDFVEGADHCRMKNEAMIRFSISEPRKMDASNENSSSSGSIPGYSSSGSYSQSGNWIVVDATATLVRADGSYDRIGFRSEAFQAGSFSNYSSASGNRYSNSGGFSRSTPEDQAAARATTHSLHDLIHSGKSWQPGSAELVATTFRQAWPPHAKK